MAAALDADAATAAGGYADTINQLLFNNAPGSTPRCIN